MLRDLNLVLLTPNFKLNTLQVIQLYRYLVRGNVLSGVIFFLFWPLPSFLSCISLEHLADKGLPGTMRVGRPQYICM